MELTASALATRVLVPVPAFLALVRVRVEVLIK